MLTRLRQGLLKNTPQIKINQICMRCKTLCANLFYINTLKTCIQLFENTVVR